MACPWSAVGLEMGFSNSESELVKGSSKWGKKRWFGLWMHALS